MRVKALRRRTVEEVDGQDSREVSLVEVVGGPVEAVGRPQVESLEVWIPYPDRGGQLWG